MSTMSMRQTAGIAPAGQIVHVWFTRVSPTGSGASQVAFVNRWPGTLVHVPREESIKMGYQTEIIHTLAGPSWKGKLLQPGDLIQQIISADGTNYVRPGKPWTVMGRTHEHGIGDLNGQVLIVKEEV